ncbi:orotate phosphoribosyltransferase [Saccharolobus solfataricus]|uniref:Orotate phosphoribosyltransferase n=4 Tax=Saccharolobus TaxID=2100760 RepID=PYRE_SACS2|nr:orotate phosphoribosyltransferase [Saccharolobus solfataricus]Q9UX09.1 RecName: Full=Orotate phosphoribosyltransferase; Short=OPRT; Short=OPRTase [Saccharolobus solfataricus P2]AAK40926.1 Orotate phosphoribosyltransferase (OPRT) (pyrE) [Saccharolobus solfataricus P2]AKA73956.1 orotate phosphoribosyltransferase [Saccharolobus solfataricus]AKA76653.1 orotate phosphoribosyltransferase [Saccharolobus solfataricus]AKA79347.1 orotate phosphoribosyltransferase [Saccharolobus solfataricus]AZF68433
MNFAEVLLERKLLLIGSFVLTSGKVSPYYLDLRPLPNYPEFYDIVNQAIKKAKDIPHDIIVGIATGGVPLSAFIACNLKEPMGYIRIEKKGHGTNRTLELDVKGKRVLLVDDVATTGVSIEKATLEILNGGGKVSDALVIIDRQEGASQRLEKLGVKLHSLFKISEILDELLKSDKLKDNEKKSILDYLVKNVEK